jgi:hypothetical protein
LIDADLPQSFWAEAISTAAYLVNRSPTSTLKKISLFEAWHKKKPNISHLKIFGADAYVHVLPKARQQGKLEARGIFVIFVGYDHNTNACRFYEPISRKFYTSRDVIFDEDNMTRNDVYKIDEILLMDENVEDNENQNFMIDDGNKDENEENKHVLIDDPF